MSSDANGSMAVYDAEGRFVGLCVTTVETMHKEFRDLALTKDMPLETALRPVTSSPAAAIGMYPAKGCVREGSDADLIIMDKDLSILTILIICALLTYVVPAGQFETAANETGRQVLVPGTFHYVEQNPVTLYQFFNAIPTGLVSMASLIFFASRASRWSCAEPSSEAPSEPSTPTPQPSRRASSGCRYSPARGIA